MPTAKFRAPFVLGSHNDAAITIKNRKNGAWVNDATVTLVVKKKDGTVTKASTSVPWDSTTPGLYLLVLAPADLPAVGDYKLEWTMSIPASPSPRVRLRTTPITVVSPEEG